jgi:hypothetical protein
MRQIHMDTHIIERTEIQIIDIENDAPASPVPPRRQPEQGWLFWMEELRRKYRAAPVCRYHVQAASPGLAMLSELDQSGGEIRQIPVSPGDDVPGWGKVISISQRGAAWLVKTGHGVIQ